MLQGSIIRLQMFPILTNDLGNSVELTGTSIYVDDTIIFYMANTHDDLQLSIVLYLQAVFYFFQFCINFSYQNGNLRSLTVISTRPKCSLFM